MLSYRGLEIATSKLRSRIGRVPKQYNYGSCLRDSGGFWFARLVRRWRFELEQRPAGRRCAASPACGRYAASTATTAARGRYSAAATRDASSATASPTGNAATAAASHAGAATRASSAATTTSSSPTGAAAPTTSASAAPANRVCSRFREPG